METRDRAHEMYVYEGHTIEAISLELDVPEGTLKRWASEGRESASKKTWFAQREDVLADKSSLKERMLRLGSKVLDDALATTNPQKVYAAATIWKALQGGQAGSRAAEENDEIKAAREALEKEKLGLLRERNELAREKIRIERENLDKAAEAAGSAARKIAGRSLTPEEIRIIREEMYGVFDS